MNEHFGYWSPTFDPSQHGWPIIHNNENFTITLRETTKMNPKIALTLKEVDLLQKAADSDPRLAKVLDKFSKYIEITVRFGADKEEK